MGKEKGILVINFGSACGDHISKFIIDEYNDKYIHYTHSFFEGEYRLNIAENCIETLGSNNQWIKMNSIINHYEVE